MKNFIEKIKNKHMILFSAFLILFLVLKIVNMGFKFSDENIYFYMGKIILQGQLPYKDFFFASPPIQLIIINLSLLFFGQKIILLKLIPIFACAVSGIFIFVILSKKFSSLQALIASTIYLFSFVVLTTSDHFTGIHLTTMFLIISYYFIENEKPFIAGVFSALSCLTRFYAIFAIFGILIYFLIKNKKALLSFIIGYASIFIPVNFVLCFFFKENYVSSVFLYHFLKSTGIPKLNIFKFFIQWDFLIVLFAISSLFLKRRRQILLPFLLSFTTLIFYAFYMDIYYLYLGLIIPFLSILASHFIINICQKISWRKHFILILMILILIMGYNSFFYLKNHTSTSKIEFLDEISEYIKVNSLENQTIYGSFEITPLVAMVSGRRITNNYIDTNEKTFLTGLYNINERTNLLKGKVKFVILKVLIDSNQEIISTEQIINREFLLNECTLVKVYNIEKDYSDNAVVLFDCMPKF